MTHSPSQARIRVVLLLLTLLLMSVHSSPGQGFLHSASTYILDGNNHPILLRGMGLGGWLMPEGYMLGTSSTANSPSALMNAVSSLVGDANADIFFARYREKYIQKKDIDSLARWGFNSVRLPLHYGIVSNAPGSYVEAGFAIIDSLLAWCEVNHLYLILDLHAAPGGQNSDNISDYQGYPSLWESATYQQWTAEIWKTMAARYANRTWIGGYDLLNETAWNFPSGNGPLRNLLVRITDSIRTVDRNHMIIAEGNWYATDFSGLTPAWDANMAWSFHKYWNVNDYNAINGYIGLRNSTSRPLWLGESGENSNQWFSDCVALMESNNIGWSWWTHKKIGGITSPLSARRGAGYNAVLNYWAGQGANPGVTAAMAGLMAQADLLDADSCRFHPDVLNGIFGSPTPNQRRPYAANVIPGPVFASDYDMGKQGEAYSDVDFQNTQGNGGPAYNSGWAFRNDGVDLEASSDPLGNGVNVGWTSAGEFLSYTVNVQTGGTYNISVRTAVGGSAGSLKLTWDGGETAPFTIPATGGWQNWQTVNLGNYTLDAGAHDFRVTCVTAGYNLSRITFTLIAAGVEPAVEIPAVFRLAQNFPNPFNPSTTIRYTLPGKSHVALTVTNMLGETIARLVDREQDAGDHQVHFDGSTLASGVYFYRLEVPGRVEQRRMVLIK